MQDIVVFREASWEKCGAESGLPRLTTRWVDVEKVPGVVRSMPVARDFKPRGNWCRAGLIPAMPPWVATRFRIRFGAGLVCKPRADYDDDLIPIVIPKGHVNG